MTTVANISKNVIAISAGGEVFFGWMFLFTRSTLSGIHNVTKNTASITNITKH